MPPVPTASSNPEYMIIRYPLRAVEVMIVAGLPRPVVGSVRDQRQDGATVAPVRMAA